MTDETEEETVDTGVPIDDDYIDVEEERADCSFDESDPEDGSDELEAAWVSEHDYSHTLSYEDGDGAASGIDEILDEEGIINNDGRSETRTYFFPSEGSAEHRRRYERMLQYQDGMWASERDTKNKQADRKRWVDAYCSQLDIPEYQEEYVMEIEGSVNMSHMSHFSSQQVILGIISLVVNSRGRFIRDEELFRDLMRDTGTDLDDMKTIRRLVQSKSELL